MFTCSNNLIQGKTGMCGRVTSFTFTPNYDCRECWLATFDQRFRDKWKLGPVRPFRNADGSITVLGDYNPNTMLKDTAPRAIPLDCIYLGPVEPGQTCDCPSKWRKCEIHGRARANTECMNCRDYHRNVIPETLTPQLHPTEVIEFIERGLIPKEYNRWENVQDALAMMDKPCLPKPKLSGRGIIIAGGGRYWPSVYVTIRMIRATGCTLPIQVWYLGQEEWNEWYVRELESFGVTSVDGRAIGKYRIMNGWELKTHAILNSGFSDVLYLDADCYPLYDPALLFDSRQYQEHGSVIWPDMPNTDNWTHFPFWRTEKGISPFDPETGLMLFDMNRMWEIVNRANWYNQHSDIVYGDIANLLPFRRHDWGYGDKGPMRVAFSQFKTEWGYYATFPESLPGGFGQYGLDGKLWFVHRIFSKFTIENGGWGHQQAPNTIKHPTMPGEQLAWGFFEELRTKLK